MGAWGPGLQENDTAADALDVFRRELTRAASKKGDPGEFFNRVMEHFGEEAPEAVLGVADALLERRRDLGDSGRLGASLYLRDTLHLSELREWEDPACRVDRLYQFCLRLHRITPRQLPLPGTSWTNRAVRLRKELEDYLRRCRENTRKGLFQVAGRAAKLRRRPPSELLGWLQTAAALLDGGVINVREFEQFIRAIRNADWRLPEVGVRAIVEGSEHPSIGRLLGRPDRPHR